MPVSKEPEGADSEGFWIAWHARFDMKLVSCPFARHTLPLYLFQYWYTKPTYMSFVSYSSKKEVWELSLYGPLVKNHKCQANWGLQLLSEDGQETVWGLRPRPVYPMLSLERQYLKWFDLDGSQLMSTIESTIPWPCGETLPYIWHCIMLLNA